MEILETTDELVKNVTIEHAYSVDDFRALNITLFELAEYGKALGTKDNFKINMRIENENVCVLVWGEEVIIDNNNLNRSVTLIYPQITTLLQITNGGYRPFAVNPDNGIAYWQSQLLADASMKMEGDVYKYILDSNGLYVFG